MTTPQKDDESEGGAVTINPQSREVALFGSVSDDTVGHLVSAIRNMDRRRGAIDFLLTSSGGDEEAGWALYDVIRACNNPVNITSFAACHSIAALILQAGALRLLSENCRMLIHNGSVMLGGHYAVVQAGALESKFRTQRYYDALAERSATSVGKIKGLCDKESVLSAQEALTLGLADGIIVSPPKRARRKRR